MSNEFNNPVGKTSKASKSSGRSVQSSLFMASLHKEMDFLKSNKNRVVEAAKQYLEEGCTTEEAKELLGIDGYPPEFIPAAIRMASQEDYTTNNLLKWGFNAEDSYGRIITHDDLNVEIKAASKEEAWRKTEELIDSDGDVLEVFQVK